LRRPKNKQKNEPKRMSHAVLRSTASVVSAHGVATAATTSKATTTTIAVVNSVAAPQRAAPQRAGASSHGGAARTAVSERSITDGVVSATGLSRRYAQALQRESATAAVSTRDAMSAAAAVSTRNANANDVGSSANGDTSNRAPHKRTASMMDQSAADTRVGAGSGGGHKDGVSNGPTTIKRARISDREAIEEIQSLAVAAVEQFRGGLHRGGSPANNSDVMSALVDVSQALVALESAATQMLSAPSNSTTATTVNHPVGGQRGGQLSLGPRVMVPTDDQRQLANDINQQRKVRERDGGLQCDCGDERHRRCANKWLAYSAATTSALKRAHSKASMERLLHVLRSDDCHVPQLRLFVSLEAQTGISAEDGKRRKDFWHAFDNNTDHFIAEWRAGRALPAECADAPNEKRLVSGTLEEGDETVREQLVVALRDSYAEFTSGRASGDDLRAALIDALVRTNCLVRAFRLSANGNDREAIRLIAVMGLLVEALHSGRMVRSSLV
jgi:hypothetical protein